MKNFAYAISICFTFFSFAFAQTPGSLNPNFNATGWDTTYGNNNGFYLQKALIQNDQKILVNAQALFSNEGHQAAIIRYNIDGTLDASFGGGDGMIRSKDDFDVYTRAYDMALQSTGKIIIAGDQFYNTERIIRLNTDGSLDLSFGDNGIADFSRSNAEFIYKAAVQSDDKIIIVGQESRQVSGSFQPHVFIWRLTANGSLDSTFGNNGVVSYADQTNFGSYLVINDLHVFEDDKILINHSFTSSVNTLVQFRKFNANGSIDNTFGNEGIALKTHRSNDGNYTYSNSDSDENGNIFFTASIKDTINNNYSHHVYRFNSAGELDNTFDTNLNYTTNFSKLIKIKIFGNKCYVLGKEQWENNSFDKIYCFTLNGASVANFGNNGIAIINQNNIQASSDGVFNIAGNGNLYIATAIQDLNSSENIQFLVSNIIGFPYESTIGVNEVSASSFKLFPCPANHTLNINHTDFSSKDFSIRDLNGKLVYTFSSSNQSTVLDISFLINGLYFIQDLNNGNGISFIVQH